MSFDSWFNITFVSNVLTISVVLFPWSAAAEEETEGVKEEEADADEEDEEPADPIADPQADQTNEYADEFAHVTVVSKKVPGFSSDDEEGDETVKYESVPNKEYDPTKSKKPLKPKSRSMKGKNSKPPRRKKADDAPKKRGSKPDPRGGNGKRRRKQ